MDRGVKLVLCSVVLLGGFLVALAYRRTDDDSAPDVPPEPGPSLVLREEPVTVYRPQPVMPPYAAPQACNATVGPEPPSLTVRQRLEAGDRPPALPSRYPNQAGLRVARAETRPYSAPTPRIHRIIDGDTLASLAEHYLGNRNRYMEIFEANRDVLDNPEALPLGADLTIPPPGAPPATVPRDPKLVPVRP